MDIASRTTQQNADDVLVIPSLRRSEHQVAGHGCADEKLGPVVDDNGVFYKPLQNDDRGYREASFYDRVNADARAETESNGSTECGSITSLAFLHRYLPSSYGTCSMVLEHISGHADPVSCLKMEDITHTYTRPCVMDLKMGYRTWYHGAPEKKKAEWRKKDESSTSPIVGFKISGMQASPHPEYASLSLGRLSIAQMGTIIDHLL
ncbi:inositol polyphosphate multikinase [Cymbomonas tetramitiformis]|uniref:Inositol polyphosphate multikinase n=1 Tax=Cymbomonas tetramitiformis TaxID=36881 RepID=A0AAE0FLC0_9CHLO|nr:inositol polyphosphate multikinase [Cymbomonas tetramitiformis]